MDFIFCIDTSALVDLHKYYSEQIVPDLWKELDKLFENNKIISHKIVFDELTTNAKRPSSLSKWVSVRQAYFKDITAAQAYHVASVVAEFPGLIDPNHEKDQADPWLIASVFEFRSQSNLFSQNQDMAIVSQEDVLSTCKIPAVCRRYNIQHYDLFQFFDYNGWKIGFHKI